MRERKGSTIESRAVVELHGDEDLTLVGIPPAQDTHTNPNAEGNGTCINETRTVQPLDFRQNGFFDLPDFGLIALVEDPLLDSFGAGHPGLAENSHVFARGRLTYAKLARNQAAANAVLHQIAIDLRRKVLCRFFKPLKNL